MTLSFVDLAKAPITIPAFDLLREPEGAAFDFISGKAWIVDKAKPANTMLRNIGDVLSNPGAGATKVLRRKSGLLESAPWWASEYDPAGNPMGMRAEGQRTRTSLRPTQIEHAGWTKSGTTVEVTAIVAPGGNFARKIVVDNSTGGHHVRIGVPNVVPATANFWLKAGEIKRVRFGWGGGVRAEHTINLETGEITALPNAVLTARLVDKTADG